MKKNIILYTVFFLAACNGQNSNDAPASPEVLSGNTITLTEAQMKLAEIKVSILEHRDVSTLIKVNGEIAVPPQNTVSVSMPLGGYLQSTKLLPGMEVRKGEAIATMEDQQYIQLQQDYLITKSNLGFAEKEYQRQKELNESKASSDKIFQQTQMEYTNQKIALRALAEKLKLINIDPITLTENNLSKNIEIRSPISGFVSKVDVNIGKYVQPSDVLFELVDPADIHLNLKVFEKDVSRLSVGQKLMAYTNGQPDRKFPCTIILISQNISNDRTIDIHCHFEKYEKVLIPGMYMNAEIELTNNNAPSIEEEAVVSFEGKNYVFVQSGPDQFEMMEADTGTRENGFVEIKNDTEFLEKKIVTHGAYTLLMKLKNISDE